jgi:hypothetical protein
MKTLQPLTPNVPLPDRLVLFAKDTRERAAGLPPGNERDELIRKARQAEPHMSEWLRSSWPSRRNNERQEAPMAVVFVFKIAIIGLCVFSTVLASMLYFNL